jgi:hypothetical protein
MNKLKIGDRVQIKKKAMKEILDMFVELHVIPGKIELEWDDKVAFHAMMDDFLKGHQPGGRVVGFGAQEDNDSDRRCVQLVFAGKRDAWSHFYEEKDLKKVGR